MFEFLKRIFSREGQARPKASQPTRGKVVGVGETGEERALPLSIRAEGPLEKADRDFVMATLRKLVWAGFDTRADILAAALGGLAEGAATPYESRLWIEAQLDQMIAEKKSAQAAWPAIVEYDRLEAAFEALGDQGVVSAPAAGYSREEARAEAWSAYGHDAAPARKKPGVAYYALADVESALDGGPFRVSFETPARGDEAELSRRVAGALTAAGFSVETESAGRLRLRDFVWRKRSPF